jgi:hypothetical protein
MNTNLNSRQPHLSDEQFTDLLLGTNSPSVREHLRSCELCSQEAERVSDAISSFSAQSRLWAERRAASFPVFAHEPQRTFTWLHRPHAWTAAAVAVVFAAGVGIFVHEVNNRSAPHAVANVLPATVSPTTLKSDNDLLTAIDGELREDDASNAGMYGLSPVSPSVTAKTSKRMSN